MQVLILTALVLFFLVRENITIVILLWQRVRRHDDGNQEFPAM
jgi:hypothetical protein